MIRARGWWLERLPRPSRHFGVQLRWHVGRPFRAARLALRSLNYEPQHVDPWGADAERIYEPTIYMPLGLGYNLPLTLPAPDFEPVLSAPRIVGGQRITQEPDCGCGDLEYCDVCLPPEVAYSLPSQTVRTDGELLLGEAWLHAHWWWYGQERQREADDYHTWVLADRRRWRAENGLGALELAAA